MLVKKILDKDITLGYYPRSPGDSDPEPEPKPDPDPSNGDRLPNKLTELNKNMEALKKYEIRDASSRTISEKFRE
jgi:hypothetical protein